MPAPEEFDLPDLAGAVETLVTALRACLVLPEPPEMPTPPGDNNPRPVADPQPQQQAPQPVQQQPVQQATYPGYAPTGAEEVDGPSPTAIAMALAVLAGGLTWSQRRWRAARSD